MKLYSLVAQQSIKNGKNINIEVIFNGKVFVKIQTNFDFGQISNKFDYCRMYQGATGFY